MFISKYITPIVLTLALLFPGIGVGDYRRHNDDSPRHYQIAQKSTNNKTLISKSQAINIAKRQYKGRALSAELAGGNQPFYRVKLLTKDGRVKTVRVDASSK